MTARPRIHRTDLQMRFSDTDALGHVNNVAYASYAETGRVDFLHGLGKSILSMILANVSIDFRRQVSFGESLRIETWVETIGTSSITLGQTVWTGEHEAANIRSVVVHFDYHANRAVPLPPDVRAQLEPFLAPR